MTRALESINTASVARRFIIVH